LDQIKKIALVVIVASIVIGSAFGLLASSTTPKNQQFLISATIVSLEKESSCPNIPANFTIWTELHVHANETNLILVSLTALTTNPTISLTITLDSNKSAYVFYRQVNSTYENIFVPLPNYYPVGTDIILSANYYYGGDNPTTPVQYAIGAIPVRNGTLSC